MRFGVGRGPKQHPSGVRDARSKQSESSPLHSNTGTTLKSAVVRFKNHLCHISSVYSSVQAAMSFVAGFKELSSTPAEVPILGCGAVHIRRLAPHFPDHNS